MSKDSSAQNNEILKSMCMPSAKYQKHLKNNTLLFVRVCGKPHYDERKMALHFNLFV